MSDGLGIGGKGIVFFVAQIDISTPERFEDVFDEGKTFLGCTMSD